MPRKLKVLLDTSVIISALNSKTGASAETLNLARRRKIRLAVSSYILGEAERVIKERFPKLLPSLAALKGENLFTITKDPSIPKIRKAAMIIKDPKDAPILASAIEAKADCLLTLDRKDFIDDPVVARKSKLKILTPGSFIKLLKSQSSSF